MTTSSSPQDVFDLRKIRRLVELMKEHELSEIDLRQGEVRIQLRRGAGPVIAEAVARPAPTAPPATIVGASPAKPAAPVSESTEEDHFLLIKSPIVGTFYTAPDPDSPAYVKVGDHVGPETTVCIVEAMKVFNEIPAEVAGKIAVVLVENGEPVEFGQPLFKVDTRQ